jgi:hypothetical protein
MTSHGHPNKRIEPMTRSAVTVIPNSGGVDALLVMAHPGRYATEIAHPLYTKQ